MPETLPVLTKIGKRGPNCDCSLVPQTDHGTFERRGGSGLVWREHSFPSGYPVAGFEGDKVWGVGRQVLSAQC